MQTLRSITPASIEQRKRELAGEAAVDMLEDYQILHTGTLLEVAYQQESYALAVDARAGTREHHVKPRWVALVLEDTPNGPNRIVELDPTTLEI